MGTWAIAIVNAYSDQLKKKEFRVIIYTYYLFKVSILFVLLCIYTKYS